AAVDPAGCWRESGCCPCAPGVRSGTRWGCCGLAASWISRSNRTALTPAAISGGSTFTTTCRPSRTSWARNTRLMPPRRARTRGGTTLPEQTAGGPEETCLYDRPLKRGKAKTRRTDAERKTVRSKRDKRFTTNCSPLCVYASSCIHHNVTPLGVRESTRGSASARKRAWHRRLSGRRRVAASAAGHSRRPRKCPWQRHRVFACSTYRPYWALGTPRLPGDADERSQFHQRLIELPGSLAGLWYQ